MRPRFSLHLSGLSKRGLLLFLMLASFVGAAPIAHDNFNDYDSGAAVSALAGGAGWKGAWTAITGVTISSEAIAYTLDGRQLGGGRSLKLTANSSNALARAVAADSTGKDYFVSFIFQIKGGATGTPVSGTIFSGWQADDASPSYLNDTLAYIGSSGLAGGRVQNVGASINRTLLYGQTYFFVIKYTGWNGSAYTSTQVWLNPSLADKTSVNPAVTCTQTITAAGAGSAGFNGLRTRTFGLSATVYHLVDDVRVGTTWADVVGPLPGAPAVFIHPGITLDIDDLERIRTQVLANKEPKAGAWADLIGPSNEAQLGYVPHPMAIVECTSGTDFSFHTDARAALDFSLRWYVTRDPAYAEAAITIMDAWSGTLQQIRTIDDGGATYKYTHILHTAWNGHHYAEAAEIIRHTYRRADGSGWAPDKIARYETMLKTVFYPNLPSGTSQNGNWEASIIHSILAIGIFTNDRAIFERGVAMLLGSGNGAIGVYIYASGQCQETTRDRLHSQMGIGDILQACEMAWKQGVDTYSAYPDPATGLPRMALGLEYTAAVVSGQPRPLDDGGVVDYSNPKPDDVHELLETGHNHYINRQGFTMPWTDYAVKNRRAAKLYGHSRCTLTHGNLSTRSDVTMPRPLREWQSVHFLPMERLDAAIADLASDPDQDGRPNLLEYAFGSDPRAANTGPSVEVSLLDGGGAARLALSFLRDKTAAAVALAPQVSRDLIEWRSGPGEVELVSTEDLGGFERLTYRAVSSLSEQPGLFIRLRAEPTP